MKLRHVRAVAVFACVVIALTGARRSHGGGCDDSSNSSGSSSSSGGSTHHYDDDDDYGTGSTSGGGSTSTASAEPTADVRITSCVYDPSRGIVARVEATNSNTFTTYTYEFGVAFEDPDGAPVRTSSSAIPYVDAGATETLDVAASYVADSGENTSGVTCTLENVTREAQ
ncbi:hypothetical protein [Streptomyces lanatus]|uniref:Secreted protein n=1 Tax=Streptomyces lanatus TaxID=66900 RepID=A0ABV1XSY8_9ACTN|nr:hypothetical protein [Streptomyces lanatus]GHH07141.1 hypothetical protein GCM10018780_40700 [Streptomyces lanatus]